MHELIWAERALSLFTQPDRAAAITGDLKEESSIRGPYWFALQVIRTILSLFVEAIFSSPIRNSTALIIGFLLYIACHILTSTGLRSIVDSREMFYLIGWYPSFSYWWKAVAVWMLWDRIVYPFLFGLAFARLSRGKEVTMCVALGTLLAALRVWLLLTGHLQLGKGAHDFALLTLCALVGAGVFARVRAAKAVLNS